MNESFIVNSKDLFDKEKNPNLSLSARDIINNPKIKKKRIRDDIWGIIGDWYLAWKGQMTSKGVGHRLGFAKEQLKTEIFEWVINNIKEIDEQINKYIEEKFIEKNRHLVELIGAKRKLMEMFGLSEADLK